MSPGYVPWGRPAIEADRVCMRDGDTELKYADVASRVEAVAEQFAQAGIGRRDVVAVMLPDRVELLLGLLAAWRLGASATPVNPVFTPELLELCRQNLTKIKLPIAVHTVDRLPKNAVGKIDKPTVHKSLST